MTKNTLKTFSLRTWCTKKPFGYRIVHNGNLLTSCPGLPNITSFAEAIELVNNTTFVKVRYWIFEFLQSKNWF